MARRASDYASHQYWNGPYRSWSFCWRPANLPCRSRLSLPGALIPLKSPVPTLNHCDFRWECNCPGVDLTLVSEGFWFSRSAVAFPPLGTSTKRTRASAGELFDSHDDEPRCGGSAKQWKCLGRTCNLNKITSYYVRTGTSLTWRTSESFDVADNRLS